jgi:hypothetical protein
MAKHAKSIRNPATYEALIRGGMPKGMAAHLSNGLLKKGYKKGKHGGSKGGKKK